MAAKKQTFRELLIARRKNQHTSWIMKDDDDVCSASHRLWASEFLRIGVSPKFKLTRASKVLSIGSCFARNIEGKLSQAGITIASDGFSLPRSSYLGSVNPKSALNKYNTHSIESEFMFALGIREDQNMGLIPVGDDEWWDPLSTHTKPDRFEVVADIRRRINAVTRKVSDCDAVIITLGLNEVWMDVDTGVYFNLMPPKNLVRKYGDRFAIIIADLEDNLASLERTISTIRQTGRSNTKIIVTVSPVPMGATLTGMDVIVANTLSKSMLRVAAQALADKYDFVDYFPSFEIVMNSPATMTWHPDHLHVRDDAVNFVTSYFMDTYVTD